MKMARKRTRIIGQLLFFANWIENIEYFTIVSVFFSQSQSLIERFMALLFWKTALIL